MPDSHNLGLQSICYHTCQYRTWLHRPQRFHSSLTTNCSRTYLYRDTIGHSKIKESLAPSDICSSMKHSSLRKRNMKEIELTCILESGKWLWFCEKMLLSIVSWLCFRVGPNYSSGRMASKCLWLWRGRNRPSVTVTTQWTSKALS